MCLKLQQEVLVYWSYETFETFHYYQWRIYANWRP